MSEEILQKEFFDILQKNYSFSENQLVVDCLMNGSLGSEQVLKCLYVIANVMNVDKNPYQEAVTDEEGALDEITTSEFEKFVDKSVDLIVFDRSIDSWVRFYRDYLVKLERYELLHYLQLEKKYQII